MELRNALQDSFSVDLPATLALDYPTAAAIAAHIASLLPQSLSPAVAAAHATAETHRLAGGQMQRRMAVTQRQHPRMPVTSVIVGLSARFPGPASDAAGFWDTINASIDLPEQARASAYLQVFK